MNIQLKIMAKANGVVVTTIREALPKMAADGSVVFTADQLMTIMTNAGIVANSILEMDASSPINTLSDETFDQLQSHATAVVPQAARAEVAAAQAIADGVNMPAPDDMQRAIAAAAQINRMGRSTAAQPAALAPQAPLTLQQRIALEQLGQEEKTDKEVVTGQTGAPATAASATAKPISAANQERNRQIQERLRRQVAEGTAAQATPTPQPRAIPRVAPRPTVTAAAVQAVMEAQPVAKPVVRAAVINVANRQGEISAAAMAAQAAAKVQRTDVPAEVTARAPLGRVGPGPRPDGYQPAVGSNRDVKTATPNIQGINSVIPESEMLAGANSTEAYDPIPGVNVNVPSPYMRMTDPEFSEFAKLFEVSAFTPDCKGFVGLGHEDFPWFRDIDLTKLEGPATVSQHQGFYGFNPHNGGPTHVMIRLPRNIVIWNFNHTPGNCRIFYIGRSNLTGIWYTPEGLDKLELFTTAVELAEARVSLAHKMAGTTYKKVGNSLL